MATHVDDLHKRTISAAGAFAEHATGAMRRISGLTDEEIMALVSTDDRRSAHPTWRSRCPEP